MISYPVKSTSSATVTSFLVHFFAFIINCIGVYNCHVHYVSPHHLTFGGVWKFLTYISMHTALLSTGYAAVVDFIQLITGAFEDPDHFVKKVKPPKVFLVRDNLMSYWVFTLGSNVTLLFFGIATIDFQGIHPPEVEKIIPFFGWYNAYIHLFPLVFNITSLLTVNYYFSSFRTTFSCSIIFGFSYLAWMSVVKRYSGYWPYGFLEKLSFVQFAIFVIFVIILFTLLDLLGRKVASMVWGESKTEKYKSS